MVVVHDCGKLHISLLAFESFLAVKIVCVFDNRLSAHSFDCLLEIILPPRVLVGNLELDRLAPRALSGCWSGCWLCILVCYCDCGFIRRGFSFLPCWLLVVSFLAGCWLLLLARLGDGIWFVCSCILGQRGRGGLWRGSRVCVVCATLRGVVGASGGVDDCNGDKATCWTPRSQSDDSESRLSCRGRGRLKSPPTMAINAWIWACASSPAKASFLAIFLSAIIGLYSNCCTPPSGGQTARA